MKKNREKRISHRLTAIERAERRNTSLFLAPSLVGVALFFLVPFGIVLYYSVLNDPVNAEFVFFDNYKRLLGNRAFLTALKNTGIFSAIAVPLAVVLPLLLALLLEKKLPLRSVFRSIFISPLMVPVASVVLIWQVLFHYNGVLNDFINSVGLQSVDWFKSDWSRLVIVLLYLWKNIGYNMILFMAALANIPRGVLEAARLDGATPVRTFFRVKLPYISSSVFFVGLLSLINSFKVFREVYLLTGDYPYDSIYMLQHFMNNTMRNIDYPKMSAAATVTFLIMAVIIEVLFIVDNRLGRDTEE